MKAQTSTLGVSRTEKLRIMAIYVPIVIATLVAFMASAFIGQVSVGLAGLGVVAYVFGLRHGLDADHIAAIDNTTRKLMQDGKRPLTVGTFFSLGHSTIVVALIVALVVSTRAIAGSIPYLQSAGAILGTSVSGAFLWIIGSMNVLIAVSIYRTYLDLRSGKMDPSQLEPLLNKRGLLGRFFSPL